MPPRAASTGSIAFGRLESSPSTISRLISIPTTKKKIAIRASFTQATRESSMAKTLPTRKATGVCQNAS
jgi:hypothetical protein